MAADDVGVLGFQETKVQCVEDIPSWRRDAGALATDDQYCGEPVPREELGCLCLAYFHTVSACVCSQCNICDFICILRQDISPRWIILLSYTNS
jgi:hypothetical protein